MSETEEIPIYMTRVQALELVCLLNVLELREDAAPRFKRLQEKIQAELSVQSTANSSPKQQKRQEIF